MNAVQAGLVSKVEDWDNLKILPTDWRKPLRFTRPDYFSKKGNDKKYPEFIEITPMPPKVFADSP